MVSGAVQLSAFFSTAEHFAAALPQPRFSKTLHPMNPIQHSFFVCLATSAISLLAQDPVRPGNITAADSKTGKPVPDFMAFRQELMAQQLTPEQRIAATDQWRKTNGSPLASLRPERNLSDATETTAALIARQKQAALSAAGTADEKELAELQWEVAGAVAEMRSYDVPPETRIRMFDQFHRANREVFQEIRTLRKAISDRRRENAPPQAVQPAPRSPAVATVLEHRNAIVQEIAAKRNASKHLSPEERIAAMDRDRAFFKVRTDSLRELGRQLQTLSRDQTNDANANPR